MKPAGTEKAIIHTHTPTCCIKKTVNGGGETWCHRLNLFSQNKSFPWIAGHFGFVFTVKVLSMNCCWWLFFFSHSNKSFPELHFTNYISPDIRSSAWDAERCQQQREDQLTSRVGWNKYVYMAGLCKPRMTVSWHSSILSRVKAGRPSNCPGATPERGPAPPRNPSPHCVTPQPPLPTTPYDTGNKCIIRCLKVLCLHYYHVAVIMAWWRIVDFAVQCTECIECIEMAKL